jgi:hypothetical protein
LIFGRERPSLVARQKCSHSFPISIVDPEGKDCPGSFGGHVEQARSNHSLQESGFSIEAAWFHAH